MILSPKCHLIQVARIPTCLPLKKMRPSCLNSLHSTPQTLLDTPFLLDPQEDGPSFHACIEEQDAQLHSNAEWFKFCCSINDEQYEEILTNNEILNYIEQQDDKWNQAVEIQAHSST